MSSLKRCVFFVALSCAALGFGTDAVMPSAALAQKDANKEALKELDDLNKINNDLKQMKDLQDKGDKRTPEENDKLKQLEKDKEHNERTKKKLEASLKKWQAGGEFSALTPDTLQKINNYFKVQELKKALEDELKKGGKAKQAKVDRLRKEIAELEGTAPPASTGSGVKAASSLIVEDECNTPRCTLGTP